MKQLEYNHEGMPKINLVYLKNLYVEFFQKLNRTIYSMCGEQIYGPVL